MKKIALFLFLIYALASCDDDEPLLSCDPVVNDFVVENLAELESMSRDLICNYNEEIQRAAFRAFNPEKRLELWQSKLDEVLCNGCLNEVEFEHVYKLLVYVDITLFEEDPESKSKKKLHNEFAKQWISYARKTLNWTTEEIAFISSSLEIDFDNYIMNRMALNNLKSAAIANSEISCNCNSGTDFCGGAQSCASGSCGASIRGCGWFWADDCNGVCLY